MLPKVTVTLLLLSGSSSYLFPSCCPVPPPCSFVLEGQRAAPGGAAGAVRLRGAGSAPTARQGPLSPGPRPAPHHTGQGEQHLGGGQPGGSPVLCSSARSWLKAPEQGIFTLLWPWRGDLAEAMWRFECVEECEGFKKWLRSSSA